MPTFFDRFSSLCREKGETPNSLAKKLNIPSGSITAWKKGSIPRASTLDKIAAHFNVSLDYLLGNVSDPFFHLDNERILREINSYGDEKENAPTQEGERDYAQNEHEERMLLLARHIEPIPEEQRNQLIENFTSAADLYLKLIKNTPEDS